MAEKAVVPFPVVLKRYRFRAQQTLARRPWIMRGLLLRGHVTTLLAAGGVGKSSLGLTVGLHLCAGRNFGPWKTTKKCKVAVLTVEEDEIELDLRLHALQEAYGFDEDAAANLFLVQVAHLPLLATADKTGAVAATKVATELERLAFREQIDVLILDPFIELWRGSENDNGQVSQAAGIIRDMTRRLDAATLLMHHTKKGDVTPGDIDAGRGASSLGGLARIGFTLTNVSEDVAKELHLPGHRGFVRADPAKGNYLPAADQAHIFQFENIVIDNGDEDEPGDGVGVLMPWARPEKRAGADIGRPQIAERTFLELLEWHNRNGVPVSIAPKSKNYAPNIFFAHPDCGNCGLKELVAAMYALDKMCKIQTVQYGSPSDNTFRLEVVKCNL